MGDHTDYNDGFALPVAIDLECVVTAKRRSDGRIRIVSRGEVAELAADGSADPRAARPEWARYIAGVACALGRRGRPSVGIDAFVESTVPAGSGLSSSAALGVAVALALGHAADFELEGLDLALACQEAEHLATGVSCGIMDQLASVAGVEG